MFSKCIMQLCCRAPLFKASKIFRLATNQPLVIGATWNYLWQIASYFSYTLWWHGVKFLHMYQVIRHASLTFNWSSMVHFGCPWYIFKRCLFYDMKIIDSDLKGRLTFTALIKPILTILAHCLSNDVDSAKISWHDFTRQRLITQNVLSPLYLQYGEFP